MSTIKLDITKDHCPMTFVKAKLKLEQMEQGDLLEILLTEGEPLDKVPKSCAEQGFEVLEIVHVSGKVHRVLVKK